MGILSRIKIINISMEQLNSHVQMLHEPRNILRLGPGTLKSDNQARHPVEEIQKTFLKNERQSRKQMLARIYGNHLPKELTIEENILGRVRRLPGLRSSFVGLETLLDLDTTIEYHDFIGGRAVPSYCDNVNADIHYEMERRVGDPPLNQLS